MTHKKRAQYDQYGHVDPNQGFGGGAGGGFSGGGFSGFEDIFDTFFGGGGRQQDPNAPRQGSDLQYTMRLKFKEAILVKMQKSKFLARKTVTHVMVPVQNQGQHLKNVAIVVVKVPLTWNKIPHLVV